MTGDRYDVALVRQAGGVFVRFPSALGRAMEERGYNRAVLVVTEDGVVVTPYVGEGRKKKVEIPEWGS